MQFLTGDCVFSIPQGTFTGTEAIRTNLERTFRNTRRRLHVWSNVLVRLSDDRREGRVIAYFYAVLELNNKASHAIGGRSFDQVIKVRGEWKIKARFVTDHFTSCLAAPSMKR